MEQGEYNMPEINFYLLRTTPLFEKSGIGHTLKPKEDRLPLHGCGKLTVSEPEVRTCVDGTQIVVVRIESEVANKGYYFCIDQAGLRSQLPNAPIQPQQRLVI